LGVGPSLTTTFHDEKTYTIFVDITSSSRNSSGKMDTIPFSQKANVQVDPRLADMFVYLNGTNVTRTSQFKVTPLQARAGIIIDATATIPYGTTRFTSTKWDFGNGITSQYDTAPKIERANYFMNGQYPIKLELINNIGEKINYTLNLLVVDPIASIKTDKFIGFANEEFKFAAASAYAGYAIAYEWAIRDQDSDKIVFTANAQNISYKFPRTGKYEVRLKSKQANGKEDTDLALITVEPREPVVDFSLTRPSSETPNRIYLDATKSYDPDTNEGSKLNYTWLLDGQEITLENPSRNGAVGYFTINSL
jgi:PKD repeat protein